MIAEDDGDNEKEDDGDDDDGDDEGGDDDDDGDDDDIGDDDGDDHHDDDDGSDDDDLAGWGWSGGRDGCWRMLGSNILNYYDASTEATANIPSCHSATKAVGCSAHQRSWHTCCMLRLHRNLRANLSKERGTRIKNQQERRK